MREVTPYACLALAAVSAARLLLGVEADNSTLAASAVVQRGQLLVQQGSCNACHSPAACSGATRLTGDDRDAVAAYLRWRTPDPGLHPTNDGNR